MCANIHTHVDAYMYVLSIGTHSFLFFPDFLLFFIFTFTVFYFHFHHQVVEDVTRQLQRVVAFETPEKGKGGPLHKHTKPGKLIVVLTNEDTRHFNATVGTSDNVQRTWQGYSFQGAANSSSFNVSLGVKSTSSFGANRSFQTTLAPYTIQWWYEQWSRVKIIIGSMNVVCLKCVAYFEYIITK